MNTSTMPKFSLSEAIQLLDTASREQLVDHAFGDAEVYWFVDGESIASGYFGRSSEVGLDATATHAATEFHGDDAAQLRHRGRLTISERNDAGGS